MTNESIKNGLVNLFILLGLFSINVSYALNDIPYKSGWSGYVGAGLSYLNAESNTMAGNGFLDVGDKYIDNVSDSASANDDLGPTLLYELNYTFADQQQIFLVTSVEDNITLDSVVQLGWRKQIDAGDIFQVGVLASVLPQKVWADPYLTGENRDETDKDSKGFRFTWDRILGTMFEIQLTERHIEVDNEKSGRQYFTNNPGDINDPNSDNFKIDSLRREGDETKVELAYLLKLSERHSIRPLVGFSNFDADGHGEGYESANLKLTYFFFAQDFDFSSTVNIGKTEFDDDNPIYEKKQDSDIRSIDANLLYDLPFESGQWQVGTNVLWGEIDSDINFHDTEVFRMAFTLIYNFG